MRRSHWERGRLARNEHRKVRRSRNERLFYHPVRPSSAQQAGRPCSQLRCSNLTALALKSVQHMATENQTNQPDDHLHVAVSHDMSRRRLVMTCVILLLFALGVRLMVWQYNRAAIAPVMSSLTAGYKDDARILARGDLRLFLRGPDPPSNATVLAHPPGYSILMAAVFLIFGESDFALRLFQIFCDAISVVVVFLIGLELTSKRIALIAGALVAFSPQLAYNSLLLLPDSLSVLPILFAIYLLTLARSESRRWLNLATAGAMLGLSCWLRPNGLLLSLFAAALIMFFFERGHRFQSIVPLVGAAVLLIAPMTIRNLIVFDHFIPISLGSGLNLIEGIADYDSAGTLGMQKTDMELLEKEAQLYNRAEYGGSFFNPVGVQRERERVARGLSAIRSQPFWFIGVMIRRSGSMLRLERVPVISGSPLAVTSDFQTTVDNSISAKLLRIPAIILKTLQKLFITAVMLPLALIGLFVLVKEKRTQELAFLIVVPVYFICVQSLLHTEYRYVLAIQYFLLVLVAVSLNSVNREAWQAAHMRKVKAAK